MKRTAILVLAAGLAAALVPACGGARTDAPAPVPAPPSARSGGVTPATEVTRKTARIQYPATRRGDVVDTYFGHRVPDPYRWLEDDHAKEVEAWVRAQNAVTFSYLDGLPERAHIERRLEELWNYERYSVPVRVADRYFFSKNDGLQNQSVLYWTRDLDAEPTLLLDPNGLSKDGTVALATYSVSEDGKYLAYALARAGSDWNEFKIRDVDTGKDLPETLQWVKFSGATWTPDNAGFYYARYPEPKPGEELRATNMAPALYYHRVGTAQSEDQLVFRNPDRPKWSYGTTVSEDGRYLVVSISKGTGNHNLVYAKDLRRRTRRGPDGERLTPIIGSWGGGFGFLGNDGPIFYFQTDDEAPRGRIVAIDSRHPQRKHWREVVPQSKDTLGSVNIVGNRFFASYLVDASTRVRIFDMKGKPLGEVPLPGLGSASGFGGRRKHHETFYAYTSFNTPTTVFRYDIDSGKSTVFRAPTLDFDPDDYVTEQVFYESKDGTRVPMFVSHKKGIEKDGTHPTLLYGYGGFDISLDPFFSVRNLVWMELGGVLAIPNLRGGGEYGREWHEAGIKEHKQNVFDDFIAAAEWLEKTYTSPDKLAINGASNGGLLVGACLVQRPDLFGAAVPQVGVLDMLRFHRFTIGWAWIDDYGSSDDPDGFEYLRKYSPYHNVQDGAHYPATLITTGDHDDRVVPAHSFKFAAAMQRAQAGNAPILIRIQTNAGHGAGKPTAMRIRESADILAFISHALGVREVH